MSRLKQPPQSRHAEGGAEAPLHIARPVQPQGDDRTQGMGLGPV